MQMSVVEAVAPWGNAFTTGGTPRPTRYPAPISASVADAEGGRPSDDLFVLLEDHDCSYVGRWAVDARRQREEELAAAAAARTAPTPSATRGAGMYRSTPSTSTISASSSSHVLETSSMPADFHVQHSSATASMVRQVLSWLLPKYIDPPRRAFTADDLKPLSSQELLELLRVTLGAGDRIRSALIARELSDRRAAVDLQMTEPNVAAPSFHQGGIGSSSWQPHRRSTAMNGGGWAESWSQ